MLTATKKITDMTPSALRDHARITFSRSDLTDARYELEAEITRLERRMEDVRDLLDEINAETRAR